MKCSIKSSRKLCFLLSVISLCAVSILVFNHLFFICGGKIFYRYSNKLDIGYNDTSLVLEKGELFYDLKELYVYDHNISDIGFLNKFDNLEKLTLYTPQVTNYESIANCQKLKFLYIGNGGFDTLTFLEDCNGIETLALISFSLKSLDGIQSVKSLKTIDILAPHLSDIRPISELTDIQSISIIGNEVMDFTPLSACKNLEILDVRGSSFGLDMNILSDLVNLKKIYIDNQDVLNISVLCCLPKLETIVTNKSFYEKIEPIQREEIQVHNINFELLD